MNNKEFYLKQFENSKINNVPLLLEVLRDFEFTSEERKRLYSTLQHDRMKKVFVEFDPTVDPEFAKKIAEERAKISAQDEIQRVILVTNLTNLQGRKELKRAREGFVEGVKDILSDDEAVSDNDTPVKHRATSLL